MTLKLEAKDHVGEELSEVARQFIDGDISAHDAQKGWILALSQMTIMGPGLLPENQVRDLAIWFNQWGS